MSQCMRAGCEEEAVRGLMYCSAHRPGRGTRVKKVFGFETGGRKPGAKKAAKRPAKKR